MANINKITDKVKIDNTAGNGKLEVEVNQNQTVIKSSAIELTGTLTNNGQAIGTPGDGKLTITVNSRTELSQGFSANQSGNTTAHLTTGLFANVSSSANITLVAECWMECTGTVSGFSLVAGSDFSTSEYAGTFTTGNAQTSVTFSFTGEIAGYTMQWVDGSEDPTDLTVSTKYIFSIIVPRNGNSINKAYGVIKKIS